MDQSSPWITTYAPLASTIIAAAATIVLAWLTGKYVHLTASLVAESQRSRQPSVTLDFELPDHSLRLVLENNGGSPALNVKIEVLQHPAWLKSAAGGPLLESVAAVQHGVSYLAPGRVLKYYLGFPNWRDADEAAMQGSFRLTYEGQSGLPFTQTIDFDFGQMREVLFESFKDPNLAVAEAIREAERSRQSFARSPLHQVFDATRRKCPMCAERIPGDAKKCSRCGELIDEAA